MARYGGDHKQATRARILETAGRRLKDDGIEGSGVAILMKDAGLTNGAFYAHFDSKQELVAAVVEREMGVQRDALAELSPGAEGVEQLVRRYLSPQHRDHPGQGCPSAALLDEIVREGGATRRAFTEGILAIVDDIEERLGAGVDEADRARGLSAYASMIGTLQVARALTDPDLADAVLEAGLAQALALWGLGGPAPD